MSSDIEAKRAAIAELYSGPGWKRKVRNMTDKQVVAIYLREQRNPHTPKPKEESNDDPPPF